MISSSTCSKVTLWKPLAQQYRDSGWLRGWQDLSFDPKLLREADAFEVPAVQSQWRGCWVTCLLLLLRSKSIKGWLTNGQRPLQTSGLKLGSHITTPRTLTWMPPYQQAGKQLWTHLAWQMVRRRIESRIICEIWGKTTHTCCITTLPLTCCEIKKNKPEEIWETILDQLLAHNPCNMHYLISCFICSGGMSAHIYFYSAWQGICRTPVTHFLKKEGKEPLWIIFIYSYFHYQCYHRLHVPVMFSQEIKEGIIFCEQIKGLAVLPRYVKLFS